MVVVPPAGPQQRRSALGGRNPVENSHQLSVALLKVDTCQQLGTDLLNIDTQYQTAAHCPGSAFAKVSVYRAKTVD